MVLVTFLKNWLYLVSSNENSENSCCQCKDMGGQEVKIFFNWKAKTDVKFQGWISCLKMLLVVFLKNQPYFVSSNENSENLCCQCKGCGRPEGQKIFNQNAKTYAGTKFVIKYHA